MSAQYRKKPVVITAFQLPARGVDVGDDFHEWCAAMGFTEFESGRDETLIIRTLEGEMTAQPGDWIIKGVKGEFYPCKPDIFAATYENATRAQETAAPDDRINLPAAERIQAVLASTFGGMHHVFNVKKFNEGGTREYWTVVHSGSLSSFDFDELTRLVFWGHEFGVRVDLGNGGPRALKIMLHARYGREGGMSTRHPTMAQAIERIAPYFRAD